MDATMAGAKELRAAFERARDSGTAQEARSAAVAYYRHRAVEGGTQTAAAQELGITQSTLAKWHQREASGAAAPERAAPPRELEGEGGALRAAVEGLGPRTPSRRFPEELKRRMVRWAETRRAAGAGTGELEEALGVPWASLSKWMRGTAPRRSSPPKLKPVSVVQAPVGVRPILRTPSGFIVEGLDVAGLAELLRRL